MATHLAPIDAALDAIVAEAAAPYVLLDDPKIRDLKDAIRRGILADRERRSPVEFRISRTSGEPVDIPGATMHEEWETYGFAGSTIDPETWEQDNPNIRNVRRERNYLVYERRECYWTIQIDSIGVLLRIFEECGPIIVTKEDPPTLEIYDDYRE